MAGNPQNYLAVIKVVGIGGGGVNAVNRMIDAGPQGRRVHRGEHRRPGVAHERCRRQARHRRDLTRGLGAGSDPEVGRQAAEAHRRGDRGGAQGRRHGLHHRRQGRRHRHRWRAGHRRDRQEHRRPDDRRRDPTVRLRGPSPLGAGRVGIQKLKEKVDTQIVIPNDRLLTVSNEKTSMVNAFKMADEVLLQGVQGITDLITTPGLINTDFADVKMIMTNAGSALMGIGHASGEGRALNAARDAISSPLLEASIEGARGILLSISGGSDLGLFEVNEAAEVIHGVAHPDANIIFGTVIDDEHGRRGARDRHRRRFRPLGRRRHRRGAAVGAAIAHRPTCSVPTSDDDDDLGRGRRRVRRPVLPEVARPLHRAITRFDCDRGDRPALGVRRADLPGPGSARSTATGWSPSTRPASTPGAEADARSRRVPGAVLAVVHRRLRPGAAGHDGRGGGGPRRLAGPAGGVVDAAVDAHASARRRPRSPRSLGPCIRPGATSSARRSRRRRGGSVRPGGAGHDRVGHAGSRRRRRGARRPGRGRGRSIARLGVCTACSPVHWSRIGPGATPADRPPWSGWSREHVRPRRRLAAARCRASPRPAADPARCGRRGHQGLRARCRPCGLGRRPGRHRRELRAGAGGQGPGGARGARHAGTPSVGCSATRCGRWRRSCACWQTVDRPALAAEIARRAPGRAVLVQVNVSGRGAEGRRARPTRSSGWSTAARDRGLLVDGLMAIAPAGGGAAPPPGLRCVRSLADRLGWPSARWGCPATWRGRRRGRHDGAGRTRRSSVPARLPRPWETRFSRQEERWPRSGARPCTTWGSAPTTSTTTTTTPGTTTAPTRRRPHRASTGHARPSRGPSRALGHRCVRPIRTARPDDPAARRSPLPSAPQVVRPVPVSSNAKPHVVVTPLRSTTPRRSPTSSRATSRSS